MSVILITNWRAARQARNLAEALSSDPRISEPARARSLAEVMRREKRARNPVPAEVIYLDTRLYELRASLRRSRARRPKAD